MVELLLLEAGQMKLTLFKARPNRLLPRTDKELQMPRIIRVKAACWWRKEMEMGWKLVLRITVLEKNWLINFNKWILLNHQDRIYRNFLSNHVSPLQFSVIVVCIVLYTCCGASHSYLTRGLAGCVITYKRPSTRMSERRSDGTLMAQASF